MINSYLVAFADLEDHQCWVERFEGRSIEEVQDKIRQHIVEDFNFDDNLPLNYNEMKKYLDKNYSILIGDIEDFETL